MLVCSPLCGFILTNMSQTSDIFIITCRIAMLIIMIDTIMTWWIPTKLMSNLCHLQTIRHLWRLKLTRADKNRDGSKTDKTVFTLQIPVLTKELNYSINKRLYTHLNPAYLTFTWWWLICYFFTSFGFLSHEPMNNWTINNCIHFLFKVLHVVFDYNNICFFFLVVVSDIVSHITIIIFIRFLWKLFAWVKGYAINR